MRPGPLRLAPMPILVALTLVLSVGLATMWFDQHGKVRNSTWVPPKSLAPDVKVPQSAPPGTSEPALFAAVLERPIFAPDRRPPPPPPPPTPAPPPDPLANTQILGSFSGASAGVLARVDGKVRRIKLNESIGPWVLKTVDDRNITFVQGEEKRVLRLAYARLDVPVPKPAAVTVNPPATPNATPGVLGVMQRAEDETRDRNKYINEQRALRGLPPI